MQKSFVSEGSPTPRNGSVAMAVGRRYAECPSPVGTQPASSRNSALRHSTKATASKVGMRRRSRLDVMRAALRSGRKRRTTPSSPRYAFMPSKHWSA